MVLHCMDYNLHQVEISDVIDEIDVYMFVIERVMTRDTPIAPALSWYSTVTQVRCVYLIWAPKFLVS